VCCTTVCALQSTVTSVLLSSMILWLYGVVAHGTWFRLVLSASSKTFMCCCQSETSHVLVDVQLTASAVNTAVITASQYINTLSWHTDTVIMSHHSLLTYLLSERTDTHHFINEWSRLRWLQLVLNLVNHYTHSTDTALCWHLLNVNTLNLVKLLSFLSLSQ